MQLTIAVFLKDISTLPWQNVRIALLGLTANMASIPVLLGALGMFSPFISLASVHNVCRPVEELLGIAKNRVSFKPPLGFSLVLQNRKKPDFVSVISVI